MTTIYVIKTYTPFAFTYVCDSQATIDAGQAERYTGTFVIGNSIDAQNLLTEKANALIAEQMNAGYFAVQREEIVEGGIQWHNCTLQTEPQNTDTIYQELNVPNGDWISATGLDNALTLQGTIQQQYLAWCGMNSYQTWTSWPTLPKSQTTTTGTQTI